MILNIVGDGELMSAARDFVSAFGFESRVVFHGSLPFPRVEAMLKSDTDIYMQHSCADPVTGDSEGLPVSILEAMAVGLPVVATHHAGISEAVSDGESGYLVSPGDTQAMADCLVALARDRTLRERLGQRGASIVEERFTWDIEKQRLLAVLGLLSDQRRQR